VRSTRAAIAAKISRGRATDATRLWSAVLRNGFMGKLS
jgi:hypothetical protein